MKESKTSRVKLLNIRYENKSDLKEWFMNSFPSDEESTTFSKTFRHICVCYAFMFWLFLNYIIIT